MRRATSMLARAAAGAIVWLVATGMPMAASLSVVPVRIELGAQQPIAALTVRNGGDTPAVIQLETMHWTQLDGVDTYAPTREILATPPIFTVAPGGAQIVRVGLRRAADAAQELSYRLFLQEVPPPPPPGFSGTRVVLRFGVPVFVAPGARPSGIATNALQWRARREDGHTILSATNAGAMHVELTRLDVQSAPGQTLFAGDVQNYLLPGKQHEWKFDRAPPLGAGLHLSASSDAGAIATDVTVAAP
jgi:fimbrial chaperone protein